MRAFQKEIITGRFQCLLILNNKNVQRSSREPLNILFVVFTLTIPAGKADFSVSWSKQKACESFFFFWNDGEFRTWQRHMHCPDHDYPYAAYSFLCQFVMLTVLVLSFKHLHVSLVVQSTLRQFLKRQLTEMSLIGFREIKYLSLHCPFSVPQIWNKQADS